MADLLLFLLGTASLLVGAELSVHGALALARRWGWPPWLSGLVLLAFGTSLPELFVSGSAAPLHPGLALGNVLGSNAFNVFVVLGAVLVVRGRAGVPQEGLTARPAWILVLLCGAGFLGFGSEEIPLWTGIGLLIGFLGVFWLAMRSGGSDQLEQAVADEVGEAEDSGGRLQAAPVWMPGALTLAGFGLLAAGATWFLEGALGLAEVLGWSEGFAGYLITAVGTSAPELFTSVRAARLGHPGAVLGNLFGSNVFNYLLVGGVVALRAEVPIEPVALRPQLLLNLVAALILALPFLLKGRSSERMPYGARFGILMVLGWLASAWWIQRASEVTPV